MIDIVFETIHIETSKTCTHNEKNLYDSNINRIMSNQIKIECEKMRSGFDKTKKNFKNSDLNHTQTVDEET